MDTESVGPRVVTYQFEIDDDDWAAWKDTVPRSKALDERLRELIAADTDGRVHEPATDERGAAAPVSERQPDPTAMPADVEERVRNALAGEGGLLDRRVEEVGKMYARLQAEGEADKSALLDAVDVEATGYADRDSVWANMVKGKDTLRVLPGVEPPPTGRSEWRYQSPS